MARVPALETAGIQKFFCGPESFTPDVRYHLGQAPGFENCYVAAGLNSIGLQSAGGIGKVMAEWIRYGRPPADLWEVDVRRNMPFQGNRKYLRERVSESLGLLYARHYPFRQYENFPRRTQVTALRPPQSRRRLPRRDSRMGTGRTGMRQRGWKPGTNTATGARTGSTIRRPNTGRYVKTSVCSTSRPLPNIAWKAGTRRGC